MKNKRPKKNNTPFKEGDVITFVRDVQKDDWTNGSKRVVIPKNYPVIIKHINDSHIWVLHDGEIHWLRCIVDRMKHATEAAIVLFGEKK